MIAACPRCSARYRVDADRIGPQGARLSCAKCQAVFRVRQPSSATAPTAAKPPPAPQPSIDVRRVEREKLVLVADPEVEAGKHTATALADWGVQPILVHDGVEAMLTIQRMLPRVVVLDAALPKMFGFQVCEVMKRNENLRAIKVVLVGAVHHKDRYRRPPAELYGADDYLERHELPDALGRLLRMYGLELGGAEVGSAAQPAAALQQDIAPSHAAVPSETPAPEPVVVRAPPSAPELPRVVRESVVPPPPEPQPVHVPAPEPEQAQAPEPERAAAPEPVPAPVVEADDGLGEEREKAERLARIVVSDIILYHPEEFEAGAQQGNAAAMLDAALEEGRSFFRERVDPRVREERDYLVAELERRASERRAG